MRRELDRDSAQEGRSQNSQGMAFLRRGLGWFLLFALLLMMSGCAERRPGSLLPPKVRTTAEPEITAEPAPLLCGVETKSKVVCLVFEGITAGLIMEEIADVLLEKNVPAVFFVSGVSANENREIMENLAAKGFALGSYGLNGGKNLDVLSAYENAYRFQVAQREIRDASGKTPEYLCCNGASYTEEMLRAATAAGLKAAVVPSAYLNHKSFQSAEDALQYAQDLIRGSILSVKLGQELTAGEYGDPGQKMDARPAIDPTPGIRWEGEEEQSPYADLPSIVAWLVDALTEMGYSFLDPEQLQEEAHTFLPKLRTLTADEQEELNPASYTVPATETPLSATEVRISEPGDFNGTVFVGDEMMMELQGYVEWRRKTDPEFMDDARFLTENMLTVEKLIEGDAGLGDLGARLTEMETKSVWLCLSFSGRSAYRRPEHLAEYRQLIGQIKEQNPDIRVVVMSVFPKVDRAPGISNDDRFNLNLMLCGMCREYGLAFADAAFAVRDELGQLRDEFCLDLSTHGFRINDAGCEAVLDFIKENYPNEEEP